MNDVGPGESWGTLTEVASHLRCMACAWPSRFSPAEMDIENVSADEGSF